MQKPWESYKASGDDSPWSKYDAPNTSKSQVAEKQERPGPIETAYNGVNDFFRSMASGASFGLADEFAATMNTGLQGLSGGSKNPKYARSVKEFATGMANFKGTGQQYDEERYSKNLAAERARDADISPYVAVPGEVAGAVLTGSGLAKGGMSLLKGAKAILPSLVSRGAAEGAAYGAAHGFGRGEGARGRLQDAAKGAVLGGATGAVTGAVARALTGSPASAAKSVKDKATQAYKTADESGVIVKANSFKIMAEGIRRKVAEAGIDKTIHPKALAALTRLREAGANNQTLKGMDILRRVVKGAAASSDADERRIAKIMLESLDDYIGNLRPGDLIAGNAPKAAAALKEARGLWAQSRKGELVEGLIERARNRAGQFTGSGYENALRTEFRNLVQNPKRLASFSSEEQALLRKVARGGPMDNAMRWLGKAAPRGIVSTVLSTGAGAAVGGPVGAIALPAAGEAGRLAATAMTAANAKRALDKVLGVSSKPVTLSPAELAYLRSVLIGEVKAEQSLVPRTGQ